MISSIVFDSPAGRLTITEADGAIVALGWGDLERGRLARKETCGRDGRAPKATSLLREARRQIEAYFACRLDRFDLPLAPRGSPHEQRVWAAMRQIPYGETRSYSDLAFAVGSGPRAIGKACGRNPIAIVIPCHRVLAKGSLGGYSGGQGLPTKRFLLALEGAAPLLPLRAKRSNLAGLEPASIEIASPLRSSQ
jgi:methylated-DNA-[protein]-cysteine S-methyltransferase